MREQHGFRNCGNETRIVGNGTFINNLEIAPRLGMVRDGLLQDRAKRRKYGLPPELRPPKLEDESARARNNYLRARQRLGERRHHRVRPTRTRSRSRRATRVSETVEGGRRTAHYRTDAPILHFFSMQSARYAVKQDKLERRRTSPSTTTRRTSTTWTA